MNSQDKNTMMRNLRSFIQKGKTGLYDYQDDALVAVEKFMRLPNGAEFTQLGSKETEEKGTKKGDYLEVVSATGSGKTRMFGTMAKAMDVPTLIVTPRNLLNKKTREEFCDEIGIPEKDIAIYDSQQPTSERKRILKGNPPPKFVITSYQSLPPLVNRHELDFTNRNDVHYRPLVILDEVHEAQGEKTSAIIRKLRENVLVAGFTATDAGAANGLFSGQKPIYNLPIVEAIKRRILCTGVRAGTIDVTIHEDWIKNFNNTPAGREYSREDLEKFAAAPSVIEGAIRHHLTSEYDDFGKLSRLPTVFYTEGVEAARYGAERFNAMAKELGVNAKAAYVSGAMGEKQYEPILEDFKKGKIQAVFNDKLLGMGFDARNATVCYSLKPSNLRHTVEQQLGRITRKQDKDYVEKYDQNKVALAFNVRGVGMNPYTFVQVLGEPAIYSDEYVSKPIAKNNLKTKTDIESEESRDKKKHHLPEGIKVRIEHGEMLEILSDANKQREGVPQKTKDFLTGDRMARLVHTSAASMYKIYGSLEKAWQQAKEKGEENFTAEGITIPMDKGGVFQSRSQYPFLVHKDMASHFNESKKAEDFLTIAQMGKAAHVSPIEIYEVFISLKKAWQQAKEKGEETFTAEGITIPTDKAGIFKSPGHSGVFRIHKDMAYNFTKPKKTKYFLKPEEMVELTDISYKNISPLYRKIEQAWQQAKKNGEETLTAEGVIIPIDKAGIFRDKTKSIFCVHKDMGKDIKAHFKSKRLPEKSKYFLTKEEMQKTTHVYKGITELYDKLKVAWLEAKEKGETSFTAEGVTIPIDKAGIFVSDTRPCFCIHKDMVKSINEQLEILPLRSIDFLAYYKMSAETHVSLRTMSDLYNKLKVAWLEAKEKGETSFTAEDITIPIGKARIVKGNSNNPFCLHKDTIGIIDAHFSKLKKTEDFLNSREMCKLTNIITYKEMGIVYSKLKTAFKQAIEEGKENFSAEGITLPVDKAKIFPSAGYEAFVLHKDLAKDLAAHFKKEKSSKSTFVKMVGGKKPISPDSEHLKRTGRVRGS